MQEFTTLSDGGFLWHKKHERISVVPWGTNGVRVRVTKEADFRELPGGLLESPPANVAKVDIGEREVTLVNGEITVSLSPRAQLTFTRTSDGATVLKERVRTTAEYDGRTFTPRTGAWHIEQRFFAKDSERIYGLGQRQHGYLDQKGCVLDLLHRNTEVSIPFMVSSEGYGFLWNYPGVGRVELGRNETRWVAESAHQIDYVIIIDDSPSAILGRYAELTGSPSPFPEWRRDSGSASCATRPRRRYWRSPGSTSGATCRSPSSWSTSITGGRWASGASTPSTGRIRVRWSPSSRRWASN